MGYSERVLAFSRLPAGHQVRLEDRVSFAYIDMSVVYQGRTGRRGVLNVGCVPGSPQVR
jgi:CRISP-associated protein Cas1